MIIKPYHHYEGNIPIFLNIYIYNITIMYVRIILPVPLRNQRQIIIVIYYIIIITKLTKNVAIMYLHIIFIFL